MPNFRTTDNTNKMNFKTNKIFYFLAITVISILTSCNSHDIDKEKVYYVSWNEGSGKNKTLIQGADAETFKELEHS